MKSRLVKYLLINLTVFAFIELFAGCGICAENVTAHVPAQAQQVSFHKAVMKFLFAMGGVALSSFLIYVGLTVYNKFFVYPKLDGNSEDDVLKTPHSADDALNFFIKKNKIGY